MKIVFCANLSSPSASGRQRLWALQQSKVEVFVLDKDKYPPTFGIWTERLAKLAKRPQLIRDSVQLSKDLVTLCEKVKPDIVWLEWPREFELGTILKLKQLNPKPLMISMQDDNPWGDRQTDSWIWKNYFNIISEFDLHLVKRISDITNLKRYGAKQFKIWEHGIFKPLFHPSNTDLKKKYPISFIGTCMDDRVEFIGYLLDKGLPVHVFGSRWKQRSNLPRRFPENFHGTVEGVIYADVIRQSQICLGLVSRSNHDDWTMRTYEVPGCASMLVAQRTPTHEILFSEGQEAMFFSTVEECYTILDSLVPDPNYCQMLGKAAYDKFIKNNWTLDVRMQSLVNSLSLDILS